MKIHIVRQGETLVYLAKKYNTPLERLLEANPQLSDSESQELQPGSKVKIPTGKIPLSSKPLDLKPQVESEALSDHPVSNSDLDQEKEDDMIPRPPCSKRLEKFLSNVESSSFYYESEEWDSAFSDPYVSMAPWEYTMDDYFYDLPHIQMAPYPMFAMPTYYSAVPYHYSSYYYESVPHEKPYTSEEIEVSTSNSWIKESSSSEW